MSWQSLRKDVSPTDCFPYALLGDEGELDEKYKKLLKLLSSNVILN